MPHEPIRSSRNEHCRTDHNAQQGNEANLPITHLHQLNEHAAPRPRRNHGQEPFDQKNETYCDPE